MAICDGLDHDDHFIARLRGEEEQFQQEIAQRGVRGVMDSVALETTGGTSASGRCGWHATNAAFLLHPDWRDYTRVATVACGKAHMQHMLRVLNPNGSMLSALALYPSGPRGRPFGPLGKRAALLDGGGCDENGAMEADDAQRGYNDASPRRLCYGQPRSQVLYPGRRFWSVSWQDNRRLQERNGPSRAHNVLVAQAGVRSILILAAIGLAPSPTDGSYPPARETDTDTRRAARYGRRSTMQDLSNGGSLLGSSVAITAGFTFRAFAYHRTPDEAYRSLAVCRGFYKSQFAAAFHTDNDEYMESWSVEQSSLDRAQAGGRTPGPTLVPQVAVGLSTDANRTVWTATLQRLWHAAADAGACATDAPLGRGACERFHLQARGSDSASWMS